VKRRAKALTADAAQRVLFLSFIDAARRYERTTGRLQSAA
jgi:hypothetical protein